jgi:hypothetical protein
MIPHPYQVPTDRDSTFHAADIVGVLIGPPAVCAACCLWIAVSPGCINEVRIHRVNEGRLETISTGQAGSRVIGRQANSDPSDWGVK